MKCTQPLFDFLTTSSEITLQSFEMSRLDEIAELRQQLRKLIEDWIDADVQARLARWLLEGRRVPANSKVRRGAAPGARSKSARLPARRQAAEHLLLPFEPGSLLTEGPAEMPFPGPRAPARARLSPRQLPRASNLS